MSNVLTTLRDRAQRLVEDLPYFAVNCLKIRPKAGGLLPLTFNRVQLEVHERLEAQLRDTGRVRALILKARQPGISTYVEARFFHKITKTPGIASFILTHSQQATEAIFGITERYHSNMPEPLRLKTVAADLIEEDRITVEPFGMGAEDFAYMAQEAPGAMFLLGAKVPGGGGHHTPIFDIDEDVLPLGSAMLAETARRYVTGEF